MLTCLLQMWKRAAVAIERDFYDIPHLNFGIPFSVSDIDRFCSPNYAPSVLVAKMLVTLFLFPK